MIHVGPAIHSVNPYTIIYFFPPLDMFLKPVVSHNIHHVLINKNFYFTPYHHFYPQNRVKDIEDYNRIFHCDLPLEFY